MNLSLGEFQALVAKAFRGAGCSWGMTEEASFAARRLAEFGYPAGEMVIRLLESIDGTEAGSLKPRPGLQPSGKSLCAICVGASIADQAGCGEVSLDPTHEPALLAPLLMGTLAPESADGYMLEWEGGGCEVTGSTITAVGALPATAVSVRITRSGISGDRRPTSHAKTVTRVELSDQQKAALEQFAHKIYAPATEASRNAGAGGADD